jgi:hypothetical protein
MRSTLTGQIRLQGRANHRGVALFFSQQSCGQGGTAITTTDAQGYYQLELAGGDPPGYLCAVQPGYLVGQRRWPLPEGSVITLPGGDVTGDNRIDIADVALLASRYGTADVLADFNADGRVDIVDLVIIAGNYARQGPVME